LKPSAILRRASARSRSRGAFARGAPRRAALQLLHEREGTEALLDQALDGAQLAQQVAVAAQRRGGVEADVGRVGERADRLGAAHRRGRDGLDARLGLRHDDLGREDLVVVEAHVDAGADQGRGRRRHRGVGAAGAGLAPLAASRDAWRRFSMRFLT
jgi:thymidine phosphorylase